MLKGRVQGVELGTEQARGIQIHPKSIQSLPKVYDKSFQKWLQNQQTFNKMHEKSSNTHSKLIPDAKSEAPGWKSELGERGVEKWFEIWWFLGTLLAIILRPKH